jgi:dipeptidyl aminopeptidase/acylaminoacyl peptidase
MNSPETLYQLQFASDPHTSHDGRLVAFVVTRIEDEQPTTEADKKPPRKIYRSGIWLSRDGRPAAPFTAGVNKDASPRFSPDGTQLAFLSSRPVIGMDKERAQLFVMPTGGGEARALTQLVSGVANPQWSPDGQRIAFLSKGDYQNTHLEDGTPWVVERLRYKANGLPGPGVRDDEPQQLWLLDLATNDARALTTHPCDVEDFDWLPDGSGMVFTAAPDEARGTHWRADAFLARLDGTTRQLTDWDGVMASPAVSPDGAHVAVVANPNYAAKPGDRHLFVFPLAAESEQFAMLKHIDRDFDNFATNAVNADSHYGTYLGGPHWQADGSLLISYTLGGSGAICRATLDGEITPLVSEDSANIAAFHANQHGQIALLRETSATLCDAYLWNNGALAQLSHISEVALNGFELSPGMEHIELERDGFTVEGWLMKPVGWQEGTQYPVILSIHGGPATAYGHTFFHEFQVFASHSYAVLFGNIRGSVGYGEAQTAGTQGRYGAGDYADLMALLDTALERYPWLDRERQAVMGGSYGGIMTNWIISHTDRFKVAVTDRCISNWVSFFGTSDIGYNFTPRELQGALPDDVARLWDMSPLKYARHVKTPTLIIHSEEDHRCPIEQAEQWYIALHRLGVPVRFVRFPGENHELNRAGRPDRRVIRLQEYLAWLEKYL